MPKVRISISMMMAAVLMAALWFGTIKDRSDRSVCLTFNVMAAVLLLASIMAKFRPGPRGAWWFGFALFGWANLVLGFLREEKSYFGLRSLPSVLVVQFMENVSHPWLNHVLPERGRYEHDKLVMLSSLPLGLLGGYLCRAIAKRLVVGGEGQSRSEPEPPEPKRIP